MDIRREISTRKDLMREGAWCSWTMKRNECGLSLVHWGEKEEGQRSEHQGAIRHR